MTTISGFLSSPVKLHGRRTISGKLLAFGFVAKIVTTPCRLGLRPAAQNFLATIWPLIEILRSLVVLPLDVDDCEDAVTPKTALVMSGNRILVMFLMIANQSETISYVGVKPDFDDDLCQS